MVADGLEEILTYHWLCVLLCAGILCLKAGENDTALKLFESLAELQPNNKAVLKQVQILQGKLKSSQHH